MANSPLGCKLASRIATCGAKTVRWRSEQYHGFPHPAFAVVRPCGRTFFDAGSPQFGSGRSYRFGLDARSRPDASRDAPATVAAGRVGPTAGGSIPGGKSGRAMAAGSADSPLSRAGLFQGGRPAAGEGAADTGTGIE